MEKREARSKKQVLKMLEKNIKSLYKLEQEYKEYKSQSNRK